MGRGLFFGVVLWCVMQRCFVVCFLSYVVSCYVGTSISCIPSRICVVWSGALFCVVWSDAVLCCVWGYDVGLACSGLASSCLVWDGIVLLWDSLL